MSNILLYSFVSFFLLFQINYHLYAQLTSRDAEYSNEVVLMIDENGAGATYIEKGKYVILNLDGLKFCNLSFDYDFNSKIETISASIKSLDGRVLEKLKKSDIKDINAQSDGSLFIDTRIKTFFLGYTSYPFILEYEVKKKYDKVFFYPSFIPKMNYKLLNLASSFKLIVPDSSMINIYKRNIGKATIAKQGNSFVYEWNLDSLPPIADESFSYPEYWDAPIVMLAPANFNLEYEGSNNSWIEFGNWIYKLNHNRGILTKDETEIIDSILVDASTNFQKVDILYRYLQNNTRYVSIQEGIGSWQPFSAEFVCNNKYGDCKALTNYMLAILKYAGIKSYYTLVKSGNMTQDIVTDFSSNQFNHVILMVPIGSDTIWLDCTSKLTPTGFVEKFISDRHVLIIDENKSYLAKTPTYDTLQNIESYKGTIRIKTDLTGSGEISLKRFAHRSVGSRSLHKYYNSHIVKKYSNNWLNIPSYVTSSQTHTENVQNFIPYTIDSISFEVNIAGKKAGPELFLTYPLDFMITEPDNKKRITDIFIPESFKRTDSLAYILPEGYELVVPVKFEFNSEFGNISFEISSEGKKVLLFTSLSMYKGKYPKEKIHNFKEFLSNIKKIESYEIIISPKK